MQSLHKRMRKTPGCSKALFQPPFVYFNRKILSLFVSFFKSVLAYDTYLYQITLVSNYGSKYVSHSSSWYLISGGTINHFVSLKNRIQNCFNFFITNPQSSCEGGNGTGGGLLLKNLSDRLKTKW